MMRRFALTLIVSLYVIVRALDALSMPADLSVPLVTARIPVVGECFDGDRRDWFTLQYAHAPRIIRYEEHGC